MGEARRRWLRGPSPEERAAAERARNWVSMVYDGPHEDPDDRAIREAHGFTMEDDFQDRSIVCRNGCGNTYYDIAVGKMRHCPAE